MSPQIDYISSRVKTWNIFEGNFKDLCIACDEFKKPTDIYESNGVKFSMPPDIFYQKQGVERKFHNFLASAKTLVDHTRVLMKAYEKYDCEGMFQIKMKHLKSSAIVKFCHDLRNYFLHVQNPIDRLQVNGTWYEKDNHMIITGQVCISKKSLLIYSGWTIESKEYIAHTEEVIELKAIAEEYFASVSEIKDWLNNVFPNHIPRHEQI